ncbi:hypothetical protein JZ751_026016 [Albula glossodonta]|uniref:Fe2OG dioxygenase domain-containing protein n=1 Tax=Albula glossodonta TaxID=121402 RepID=A0A8T2MQ52_9TELE|nr:hypothetical protein JZ751_026016 [Albula glossodonta]
MKIPVVDFEAYRIGAGDIPAERLQNLGEELKAAFTEVGFVYLKNTGIDQQEVKPSPGGRPEGSLQHKWPSQEVIGGFRERQVSFFLHCKDLSLRVLRVMALSLGLDADLFLSKHRLIGSEGNGSTLRTLYYPPVRAEVVKEGQLRCGEHSDYGTITLVFQSQEGGLQVLSRSGEFISAPSIPGTVLINIADLMQRWTGDIFISAIHRVLLPPPGDLSTRQSLAFFVQPDDEALITCCDGSEKYPPVKSVDYLMERFRDSYGRK